MKNFLEIKDVATRNLVRGLIQRVQPNPYNQNKPSTINHKVNRIRVSCPIDEIYELTELLITSPLLKAGIYFDGFPKKETEVLNFRRHDEIELIKELNFQIARINSSKAQLIEMLNAINKLNQLIFKEEPEKAIDLIEEIIASYGYSHTIFKKIAFIHTNYKDNNKVSAFAKSSLESRSLKPYSSHYFQMYEIFDDREDYLHVLINWSQKLKKISINSDGSMSWWGDLYESSLWPFCYTEDQFSRRLLTFASFSLIDAIFFLLTHKNVNQFFDAHPKYAGYLDRISDEIISVWDAAFSVKISSDFLLPKDRPTNEFEGNSAYRISMAFLEYSNISTWRSSIDVCYRNRCENSPLNKKLLEQYLNLQSFYPNDIKIKDICIKNTNVKEVIGSYNQNSGTTFYRTIALLYCLDKGEKLVDIEQENLCLLLNQTTRLAFLLSFDELNELHSYATKENQLVIAFLTMCMLYEIDPNDDRDYNLRFIFQLAVMDKFEGDILILLDWLNKSTPELSKVIAQLCDVAFLEKLYLLIDTFDKVLKTREKICSWIGINLNMPEYIETARRLAIDIKVRDIKEDIDDTRIYVDEFRFKLWLEENIKDDIERLSHDEMFSKSNTADLASLAGQSLDELALSSGFGVNYWLIVMCQKSFSEFCENKIFGITSYLSRRIRHGTLEGFLLSPVTDLIAEPRYQELRKQPRFIEKQARWLEQYEKTLNILQNETLHFKSPQKSNGAFSSNIFSDTPRIKTFLSFYDTFENALQCDPQLVEILPLIASFCWGCLQTDLLKIKQNILQKSVPQIKNSIRSHFNFDSKNSLLQRFRRELDTLVSTQFQEFSGWFEKPDSVSTSANIKLLYEVVLREAQKYHNGFNPRVHYFGEFETKIYGSTLHQLYDCLFVFMINAATHGNQNEDVTITTKMKKLAAYDVVSMEFKSLLKDDDHKQINIDRILAALESEPTCHYMTTDKGSGLRKVKNIISDEWILRVGNGYEVDKFTCSIDHLTMTFTVEIPIILL